MRHVLSFAALLAAAPVAAQTAPAPVTRGPQVGDVAPDFTLPGATKDGVTGKPVTLSALRGRTVVLAFFPRARTGGCTRQMREYRDRYAAIFGGGKDVTLLAISTDSASTLASWAKDENFPFTFVADAGFTAGKAYGVIADGRSMASRVLFVIGPDGKVTKVMRPFLELDPTAYTDLGAAIAAAGHGAHKGF